MKKMPQKYFLVLVLLTAMLGGCAKDNTSGTDGQDIRTGFLGRWSVNENWTKLTYEVTITTDPNSADGVLISNFGNIGEEYPPAGAFVNGNKITLDPDQVIGDITINGSGNRSGNVINWNYTLDDQATLIQAVAVYTRL